MELKSLKIYDEVISFYHGGSGRAILLLHGNPASNYLWRNIAPNLTDYGEVFVPNLVGMGKVTPQKVYSFSEHVKFIEKFIEELDLKNIILVLHDWGSAVGLNYFSKNLINVSGIVLMEAILSDVGDIFSGELAKTFTKLRSDDAGWKLVGEDNFFLEQVLPSWSFKPMSDEVLAEYRKPFQSEVNRKIIHNWVKQVPMNGEPNVISQIVNNYKLELIKSKIPKLIFSVQPGLFMPKSVVNWFIYNVPNSKEIKLGDGYHFVQEDHPEAISNAIIEYIKENNF